MSTFHEKIKRFRISNNLSQAEFAEKTGVSRGYIQQLEKGTKYPSNKYISKIENVFNVSKNYFIKEKYDENNSDGKYILMNNVIVKSFDFDKERSVLTQQLDYYYGRIVDLMMISKEMQVKGVYDEINSRLDIFSNTLQEYLDERLGVLKLVGTDLDIVDVFKNMNDQEKVTHLNKLSETSKVFENSFFIFFNEIYNNLLKPYHRKL